jgi:hypothetical protein
MWWMMTPAGASFIGSMVYIMLVPSGSENGIKLARVAAKWKGRRPVRNEARLGAQLFIVGASRPSAANKNAHMGQLSGCKKSVTQQYGVEMYDPYLSACKFQAAHSHQRL